MMKRLKSLCYLHYLPHLQGKLTYPKNEVDFSVLFKGGSIN